MRPETATEPMTSGFIRIQSVEVDSLVDAVVALFDQPATPHRRGVRREQQTQGNAVPNVESYVSQILLKLGIQPHLHGYKYMRMAILMALEDASVLENLTHRVYPAIAKEFGSTPARIERTVRHAIELAWTRRGSEAFDRLGPRENYFMDGCPTVREFLALVVERVRLQLKRQRAGKPLDQTERVRNGLVPTEWE